MIGLKAFLQKIAALIVVGAVIFTAAPAPASAARPYPPHASAFTSQALAETGFAPILAGDNTKPESVAVFRKSVYALAFISVGAFLASAGWYKDFAMRWAHGSRSLEFVAMEFISIVAKLLAVILSQLIEHEGPLQTFRIKGSEVGWALLVAMIFSTPVEGLYYEYGLPLISAEHLAKLVTFQPHSFTASDLWLINVVSSTWRAGADQIVSVLWLDGFNILMAALFVKKMGRKKAQEVVRQETLPFYERSGLLWSITVLLANCFSRPYINFMIINAGMIFWELFLAVTSGRSEKKPLSIKGAPLRFLQRKLFNRSWHFLYQLIWAQAVYGAVFSVGLHYVLDFPWHWSILAALPLAIVLVKGIMQWHMAHYPDSPQKTTLQDAA